MHRIHLGETGDTLVEVLLATAILSVVMASAFTLTNKATRVAQTADERTQISNMMQMQAELVRAKHSISKDGFWKELKDGPGTTGTNPGFCDSKPDPQGNAFQVKIVPFGGAGLEKIEFETVSVDGTTGEITSDSEDLYNVWVEAVDDSSGGPLPVYTDFFIYACWEGIGDETLQRSGMTVRLTR